MPKVQPITPAKRREDKIYNFIIGQSCVRNIRRADIAKELGITQQGCSYKLKHRTLSLFDFIQIMDIFGIDITEAIKDEL